MAEQPEAIRSRHLKLRGQMTAEECKRTGEIICDRVLSSQWYDACQILYGYYPLEREVDCLPILRQALADGKTVALPRTAANRQMDFYRITALEQVQEGRFHVMEPQESCRLLKADDALVLVPGVAFDERGGRYGYGKGYYDRYFARFPGLLRIGLAYEQQIERQLSLNETDVRMHCVITEGRIYHGISGTL